jgi:hypothetical protein
MKKSILIYCLVIIKLSIYSQNNLDKPFHKIADAFGNTFSQQEIYTLSNKPFGKTIGSIGSISTTTCSAGYFVLHYNPNSVIGSTSTIALAYQNTICQVFSDISNFIVSPLSASTNTVKIHIYCDDAPTSDYPGLASPLYVYPNGPTNPNQGYIQNQIERGIQSGVDPFANLSLSGLPSSSNFYSGYVYINPNLPNSATWNFAINSATQTSSQYDLYTVVLHEAMHALGIVTQINANGYSKFGQANNYFTYYDKFLKSNNQTPLLVSTSTVSCLNSDVVWNSALSPSVVLGSLCNSITSSSIL